MAVGTAVIVMDAVVLTAAQPPEAGVKYVTVYVPAVLDDGVMAPVPEFIVNPAGAALYVPPVYTPVPVKVAAWAVLTDLQKGVPA